MKYPARKDILSALAATALQVVAVANCAAALAVDARKDGIEFYSSCAAGRAGPVKYLVPPSPSQVTTLNELMLKLTGLAYNFTPGSTIEEARKVAMETQRAAAASGCKVLVAFNAMDKDRPIFSAQGGGKRIEVVPIEHASSRGLYWMVVHQGDRDVSYGPFAVTHEYERGDGNALWLAQ